MHVVETHVRGDPPAALAYVSLPLVLLSIRRTARGSRGALAALALSSAGLVLGHSVTALIAIPALLLYAAMTVLAAPPGSPRSLPAAAATAGRLAAGVSLGGLIAAFQWL